MKTSLPATNRQAMRILSWNCNGGFRNKLHLVADFNADVLVIQECEDPINGPPIYYEWADQYVWAGRNKAKGLGIFAKNGLTLLPLEWEDAGTALFLPVEVSVGMQIVGVWTQASASSRDSYIGQFWHYFQLNRSQFGMKTLICGDFNSNSRWDKPRRLWNHTRCVSELESLGYKSLYHQLTGESQGAETQPTFYLHRNLGKDYHIDYAFAHSSLITGEAINLTIGNPDTWLRHSDHMPLIFEL
ncbi:MAG: endonuclease/exonuclease/phosphatase family protein [Hyphomonadaceae bacterium]